MRTVNAELIRGWIKANGPLGKEKLAVASGVTVSLLEKIVCRQKGPPSMDRATRISKVIGVSLDELFPEAEPSKSFPTVETVGIGGSGGKGSSGCTTARDCPTIHRPRSMVAQGR
jgi:transcriptional regulator with XRE-family HTH domain